MLCCLLPLQVNAQSTQKLTKADKEKIVNRVKAYCDLISTFSKDIEQIDKMEDIFNLCENSKVQTFDDIADLTKQKSGEYHSVPLFQYLQNITTKYENSINITYSDFKCERTVSEPSLGGGLEGNTYAIVHVVKTLKAKGLNKTIPLKITLNTNNFKIGGTVSETYEDPNMLYLKGLEAKDNSDYEKAIEYLKKNFNLFLNNQLDETKNNIKTLIYQTAGMLYAERQDKVKAYEYLQKLQEMNGPIIALAIANIYNTLKEYDNAIHFYKIGAQEGNADCANIMSLYYLPDTEITSDMVEFDKYLFSPRADKDYGLCFDYTKTGAEKGNINCIARLASMYLVGTKFTPTNLKEALRWTCLYADNCPYTISTPIDYANYALKLCEQQNDTEALGMLEEMEKQGSSSASYFKYFYYNYFKKDSTEAYNSIIKSAEQGFFYALNDICAFTYWANDSVNNYYWCQKMIERNYSEGYCQMSAYEDKFNHDDKKSSMLFLSS